MNKYDIALLFDKSKDWLASSTNIYKFIVERYGSVTFENVSKLFSDFHKMHACINEALLDERITYQQIGKHLNKGKYSRQTGYQFVNRIIYKYWDNYDIPKIRGYRKVIQVYELIRTNYVHKTKETQKLLP